MIGGVCDVSFGDYGHYPRLRFIYKKHLRFIHFANFKKKGAGTEKKLKNADPKTQHYKTSLPGSYSSYNKATSGS